MKPEYMTATKVCKVCKKVNPFVYLHVSKHECVCLDCSVKK